MLPGILLKWIMSLPLKRQDIYYIFITNIDSTTTVFYTVFTRTGYKQTILCIWELSETVCFCKAILKTLHKLGKLTLQN